MGVLEDRDQTGNPKADGWVVRSSPNPRVQTSAWPVVRRDEGPADSHHEDDRSLRLPDFSPTPCTALQYTASDGPGSILGTGGRGRRRSLCLPDWEEDISIPRPGLSISQASRRLRTGP